MQKELAVALRLVILDSRLLVRVDVRANEPRLAVPDVRVRLLQADATLAERFHLAPGQHEAGLEALEEVIVVPRLPVLRNRLFTGH